MTSMASESRSEAPMMTNSALNNSSLTNSAFPQKKVPSRVQDSMTPGDLRIVKTQVPKCQFIVKRANLFLLVTRESRPRNKPHLGLGTSLISASQQASFRKIQPPMPSTFLVRDFKVIAKKVILCDRNPVWLTVTAD